MSTASCFATVSLCHSTSTSSGSSSGAPDSTQLNLRAATFCRQFGMFQSVSSQFISVLTQAAGGAVSADERGVAVRGQRGPGAAVVVLNSAQRMEEEDHCDRGRWV